MPRGRIRPSDRTKEKILSRNPYEVLGVSESATDEEINGRLPHAGQKISPDKYIDEDLKEIANEKMKQIKRSVRRKSIRFAPARGQALGS